MKMDVSMGWGGQARGPSGAPSDSGEVINSTWLPYDIIRERGLYHIFRAAYLS